MHQKRFVLTIIFIVSIVGSTFGQQADPNGSNGVTTSGNSASTGGGAAPDRQVAGTSSGGVDLPPYFYKHLTGTIGGKYHIVMDLTRIGDHIIGEYYYADRGIPLFFGYGSTIARDGSVHLIETNELEATGSSDVTGTFDGRFVGQNELRGTWKKSADSSPLSFAATTIKLEGGSFDLAHMTRGYYARSEGSASIDVTYPVMRTGDAETDAAFNANVLTTIVGMYENGVGSVPPTTVNQAMSDFIATFTSQLDKMSVRRFSFPPWTYSLTSNILFNSDGILSLRYESFSYEGGAHPNTVYRNASYVRTTGSQITLDDIFQPGFRNGLNAIGLKEFKRERGIPPEKTLQDAGYFVSDKEFQLNSNFLVTKAGLLFQFNQYEIGPYYFGAQQVLIPYGDLSSLLLPNTPISPIVASAEQLTSGAGPGSGASSGDSGAGGASATGASGGTNPAGSGAPTTGGGNPSGERGQSAGDGSAAGGPAPAGN